MTNVYERVSTVNLNTKLSSGKTILDDVYFTSPFKVMRPFYITDEYIRVVIMSSSAGIMAGDSQEYNINVGNGTKLELTSQSYEKIHKMIDSSASRKCTITVGKNAMLKYNPQPTIPFAESNFESLIKIELADESSRLFFTDIISCGRCGFGEEFKYTRYKSTIDVKCNDTLIYRDNTNYMPNEVDMTGYGYFEGYTHLANIYIANVPHDNDTLEKVGQVLDLEDISAGFSVTKGGNINIKILGYSGDILSSISNKIIDIFEEI